MITDQFRSNALHPLRVACLFEGSVSKPTACAYIRLLLPLTWGSRHNQFTIDFLGLDDIRRRHYDVIITQRLAFMDKSGFDRLLETKSSGTKLVYDLDDDLISIDEAHPEYEHYAHLSPVVLEALAEVDDVWFSTETLAVRYGHIPRTHVVLKNALDPRLWNLSQNIGPSETFSILFMGSGTHYADVSELLSPALERLSRNFQSRFEYFSIGVDKSAFGDVPVTQITPPGNIAGSYPAFTSWLQRLGGFSLGVAPLLPTPINKSKSHIKWLEYAALGLPTVASNVGEYAVSIGHFGPGKLATDSQGFYDQIAQLGADRNLYESLRHEVADFAKAHLNSTSSSGIRTERLNLLAANAA